MVGTIRAALGVPYNTTALAQGVEIDRRKKLNQYIRSEQVRKRQIARGVSPANPPIPTSGQPPPYVAPPPPPLPPAGTDPRNRPGIRGPISNTGTPAAQTRQVPFTAADLARKAAATFNSAVTRGAGAPVDAMTGVYNAFGGNAGEEPFMGTKFIRDAWGPGYFDDGIPQDVSAMDVAKVGATTLNSALARVVGGPVDAMSTVLGGLGYNTSEKPFMGNEFIRDALGQGFFNSGVTYSVPTEATTATPPATPAATTTAAPATDAASFISAAAGTSLPTLLTALSFAESTGGTNLENPDGDTNGQYQILTSTAKKPGFGVTGVGDNPTDADYDRVAVDYFSELLSRGNGDPLSAYLAYHWGPGSFKEWDEAGRDMSKLDTHQSSAPDTTGYLEHIRESLSGGAPVATPVATSAAADPAVAALTTVAAPAAVDLAAKAGLTQEQREQASQYDMPVDPSKETQAAIKVRQTLVDEYMDQLHLGNLTEAFAVKREITKGDFGLWKLAAFEAAAEANQGDGRRAATLFSRWDTSGTKYQLQPITGKKSYYIWTKAPGEEGFTSTGKEVTYAQIASHIRYTASEEYRKNVEAASVAAQADIESDERKLISEMTVQALENDGNITVQILKNQGWKVITGVGAFRTINGVTYMLNPFAQLEGPEGVPIDTVTITVLPQ